MPFFRLLSLVALAAFFAACGGSAPAVDGPDVRPAPRDTMLVAELPPAIPMPAPMPAPEDRSGLTFDPDTVTAGRFDNGRMFTLDDPPLEYLAETYDFRPNADWFERAQLGALSFATYC